MRSIRLFLIISICAVALMAQGRPWAGQNAPGAPALAAVKEYLGLSDSQIQQLQDLRKQQIEETQSIRQQIREKNQELVTLRRQTNPDPTRVGQLVLELQRLREQLRNINQNYHERALALLDSSQKAKLDELTKQATRMNRVRAVVNGATALNLLLPPAAPGAGRGAGQQ